MSYVLRLWQQPADEPLPESVAAASDLLDRLLNNSPSQNPCFITLAQRLTARHPALGDVLAQGLPASSCAWSDGPLDGKTESAVYAIGLNRSRLEKVRPFVLEQAKALGLQAMDEQAGEVYLSSGQVLSLPQAHRDWILRDLAEYEARCAELPNQNEMKQILFERLTPFLTQHGYRLNKRERSFKCRFPDGLLEIQLDVSDNGPHGCYFRLNLVSSLYPVVDLMAAILLPERPLDETRWRLALHFPQTQWMDDAGGFIEDNATKQYKITSYSQIDAVIEHVLMKLETRLLPLLAQSRTIQGLDALLNPDPVSQSVFFHQNYGARHIISAYLARNPRLAALCDEFQSNTFVWKQQYHMDDALRCIDYVKSHPLA